jgi:hypothetical protein
MIPDAKRRPLNSKDPRWDYGYWADPKERDKVTCKLCNKRILGGIKRLKKHLAGGYGDVIPCPEAGRTKEKRWENTWMLLTMLMSLMTTMDIER